MFAFMMVIGMSSNVKAEQSEGSQPGTKGTITIDGAIDGQTYKIYRLLELESYSYPSATPAEGEYSYKINNDWNDFFTSSPGKDYFTFENGYVVGTTLNDANVNQFVKEAFAFLKTKSGTSTEIQPTITKEKVKDSALVINGLTLGYYLVDSTVGSLCGLTTTNPTATINEKNSVPTITHEISTAVALSTDTRKGSANIGDHLAFTTTINVAKGAENYILHTVMPNGLTIAEPNGNNLPVSLTCGNTNPAYTDFTYTPTTTVDNKKGFDIQFKQEYLNKLSEGAKIDIHFFPTVNTDAKINFDMVIDTWLTYGHNEHKPSITNHEFSTIKTYQIPVFKYTGTDIALAGATFKLYAQATGGDPIKFVRDGETQNYRKAVSGEEGVTDITTTTTGKFTLQGLAGTYWLEETEAPKGYNKLTKRTKVDIGIDGKITVDDNASYVDEVKVLNKSGSLLPSTGGAGTTMLYVVGFILVLGSGIVLATKKRANSK